MIRKWIFVVLIGLLSLQGYSQCAVCKKTISSLDDKSAKGLNSGILYLAAMPLLIMGFIGFRWWRQNRDE